MALIEHLATGARHALATSHLVGRSPRCDLRLEAAHVSNEHASFRWKNGAWELRDLNSRNGTFVDGRRLPAEERLALRVGQRVAFGHPDDAWRVLDVGASGLMAVCARTGAVVRPEATMLALPDAEAPEVTVYESAPGRWVVDRDGEATAVDERVEVRAGGRDWRLYPPRTQDDTATARPAGALTLSGVRLHFRVSLDEEYIELRVVAGERSVDLGARAWHGMLLALARARRADQGNAALPATAQGWVYKDDLLREVGIAESLLNLHIFQARREFERLGVADAVEVVERRGPTRQLRVGVASIEEERI